jgi:hypothetical protein
MARIHSYTVLMSLTLALSSCSKGVPDAKPEPSSLGGPVASTSPSSRVPLLDSGPAPSASTVPIDPNAPVLHFSRRKDVVGVRYHSRMHSHIELDATVVIKTIHSVADEDSEVDIEILAVTDSVATKAKVTYTKMVKKRLTDNAPAPSPSAQEGRPYLVERVGNKLVITAADGNPVDADEEREVRTLMGAFGRPNTEEEALASKPRRLGERLDDVAQAKKDSSNLLSVEVEKPGDRSTLTELTMTLTGTDRVDGNDVAVVDVVSTTVGVQGGADTTLKTHGTLTYRLVGTDCVASKAEGSSTFSKGILAGKGHMVIEVESKRLDLGSPKAP